MVTDLWHKETCPKRNTNTLQNCNCGFDDAIKPKHPPQTLMAGGKVASTKGPAFHLIPTIALVKLAERFELGQERKGDKAWNAISNNQECLLNKDWLIERCSHIIHHTMKLRDQLAGKEEEESMTDNASAIAWGGMFLICGAEAIAKSMETTDAVHRD